MVIETEASHIGSVSAELLFQAFGIVSKGVVELNCTKDKHANKLVFTNSFGRSTYQSQT